MVLYIVIVELHPDAPQKWGNEWVDGLVKSISTPRQIADELEGARSRGERVYVPRCAHGGHPPVVCGSARVESVEVSPGGS